MDAFILDCVRSQIEAILAEIDRIEGAEFPYSHSADCVRETGELFVAHKESLDQISSKTHPETAELVCNAATADLRECSDLLGFLLRSTNVRNAFEAYGPLLRLAIKALGENTRLVISSEWCFSPFVFLGYQHLPGAILIGLPATESSNPFLLPLAGHELGHSAWGAHRMDSEMGQKVESAIIGEIQSGWANYKQYLPGASRKDVGTELVSRASWLSSWTWGLRQCEEYFCDFFGLYIFGEAYLHAFAYLAAPYRKGRRSAFYPNTKTRVTKLADAATLYGVQVPAGYVDYFEDLEGIAPEQQRERTLLELADRVSSHFVSELAQKAKSLLDSKSLEPRAAGRVDANIKRFAMRVPAESSGGLANILNAAWNARINPQLLALEKHDSATLAMLTEIVLKSIEIDEIEYKLKAP